MTITINDLRRDWIKQIKEFDRVIALVERKKMAGISNDHLGKPGRVWPEMLAGWRVELVALLAEYPDQPNV